MPTTDTPLRYPGGKSQLIPFVVDLLRKNDLFYGEYAEPFAGGAGIPISLLLNNYVSRVYLNDVDPAIYAFWKCVLDKTDEFCDRIESTEVTIDEWHRQREIYQRPKSRSILDRGFSTFFLNRTNRSGIVKAGVIGGLGQTGNYKLDCRFIKPELVKKIRRIASHRDQIKLTNFDAAVFLRDVVPTTSNNALINLDPPYYAKGSELYTSYYMPNDHAELAKAVVRLGRPWLVTYDDEPEIRELYKKFPMFTSALNYSAQVKRVGVELLVMAPQLKMPESAESMGIVATV